MTQPSFAACARITRAANSSFPLAFRLLPRAKRRAMDALYAFMRVTDDLADEPGDPAAKREQLAAWRAALDASLVGKYSHPVFPALAHTVHTFGIPPRYLHDVIDGVAADIESTPPAGSPSQPYASAIIPGMNLGKFASFGELYPYCYRVASAVGLACVRVWGLRDNVTFADADGPAEAAGIAFQLTNILRDLDEDVGRGRLYLPTDEWEQFGCTPQLLRELECRGSTPHPRNDPNLLDLLRFQVGRARDYYRRSEPLLSMLGDDGRAIFGVMSGIYRALLDEIEARGYDVFTMRVRVPKWRKLAVLSGGWLTKWGWA